MTTCIVAVRVLLIDRLAVKPLVNRLAKPGGLAVALGNRNSIPVEMVSAWVVLIFESDSSIIVHCEPVSGSDVSA